MIKLKDANRISELDISPRDGLLGAERERWLATKIKQYRIAFQRKAIQEPAVVMHLYDQLQKWIRKEIRIDSICNLSLSDRTLRSRVEPLIRKDSDKLPKLADRLAQSNSVPQRRQLYREVVKMVEAFNLRPSLIESAPFRNRKTKELLQKHQELCRLLCEMNLRLVPSIARRICKDPGLHDDMIQEGYRGLMHAIIKFNPDRKIRFSTYAIPWIRQYIFAALGNAGSLICMPDSFRSTSKKVSRTMESMNASIRLNRSEAILKTAEQMNLTPSHVQRHVTLGRAVTSLDHDSANGTAKDVLTDNTESPVKSSIRSETATLIQKTIATSLTNRERNVIELRYGLNDGYSRSFSEVGKELGLTRERVRQIEKPALEKLERLKVIQQLS